MRLLQQPNRLSHAVRRTFRRGGIPPSHAQTSGIITRLHGWFRTLDRELGGSAGNRSASSTPIAWSSEAVVEVVAIKNATHICDNRTGLGLRADKLSGSNQVQPRGRLRLMQEVEENARKRIGQVPMWIFTTSIFHINGAIDRGETA